MGDAIFFGDPSTKNWSIECQNCGELPTVIAENAKTEEEIDTGLCGPCYFGEAITAGGNW